MLIIDQNFSALYYNILSLRRVYTWAIKTQVTRRERSKKSQTQRRKMKSFYLGNIFNLTV